MRFRILLHRNCTEKVYCVNLCELLESLLNEILI